MSKPTPRCGDCGEVIGVYEPLVAMFDGRVLDETSRAATRKGDLRGDLYHHACYLRLVGESTPQ